MNVGLQFALSGMGLLLLFDFYLLDLKKSSAGERRCKIKKTTSNLYGISTWSTTWITPFF
jgi:hypothetical protein